MPGSQPARRFVRRSPASGASLDRLAEAIHTLHQASSTGDPLLVPRGLEVLTAHLGADQATLATVAGAALASRWWHPEPAGHPAPEPVEPFCEWLLGHPERLLVVQDMDHGPHLSGAEALRQLPHRAALGCALRHGGRVQALLLVFFDRPRRFSRLDFTLLEAVGGFLGRMLEAEDLKQSVHRLEDALALTQALVEDTSIRDSETDLPNLRYLEVWEKALLESDDRPASLAVAECRFDPAGRRELAHLRSAVACVRAGDLVVRLGTDRFQILMRNAPRNLAHLQLLRFRSHLGGAPMGATFWVPGPERLGLSSCRPLLQEALEESGRMASPTLVWRIPDGFVDPSAAPRPA